MPAPIPIRLSRSQRLRLTRVRRKSPSRREVDRATAILALSCGIPVGRAARVLGVTRRTISNWKRRFLRGERLGDRPRSGRPPKATPQVQELLVRRALSDPRDWGYAFVRWTSGRLSEYLARKTQVRLSPKWVRILLRRHGVVWRRTKRTTRNLSDPVSFERARKALRRLKRGCSSRTRGTSCGSATGSASTCSRPPRACIGSAGSPRKSRPPGRTSA